MYKTKKLWALRLEEYKNQNKEQFTDNHMQMPNITILLFL